MSKLDGWAHSEPVNIREHYYYYSVQTINYLESYLTPKTMQYLALLVILTNLRPLELQNLE